MSLDVQGLQPLVKELKGPLFRDVNKALRGEAKRIASEVLPLARAAVAASPAPQAGPVAATMRVHSDRIPVLALGKVNPKLSGFARSGDTKRRRGAIAHGVVYGPLGGHKGTRVHENYYRVGRDGSGGRLGRALADGGPIFERAASEYLDAFLRVMSHHGWPVHRGR